MGRFEHDVETTISEGAIVRGTVRGREALRVLGRIEGKIDLEGALAIDASAVVKADVVASRITIAGVLVGDVTAYERIELLDGARVIGDLVAPTIRVDAGAALSGALAVGGDAERRSMRPEKHMPLPIPEPEPRTPVRTTYTPPRTPTEERRKKRVVIKKRR